MFFAFLCVLASVCRADPVLQHNEILHKPATLTNFGADKHHLNGIDVLVLSYNESKARFSCIVASTGKRVSITVENLRHANTTLTRAHRQESRMLASVGKIPPSVQTTDSVHALVDNLMVWAADPKEFQSLMIKVVVAISEVYLKSDSLSDNCESLRDATTMTALSDNEPLEAYIDGFSQLLDAWSLNSTKRTHRGIDLLNMGLTTIAMMANNGGNQQDSEAFIDSPEGVARTQALVNAGALEVILRAMWMTKPNSDAKYQGLLIITRLVLATRFGSPEEATYRRQRAVEVGAIEVVADVVRSLANGKWKQQTKYDLQVTGSELLGTAMMTVTQLIIGNDKTAKARRIRAAATNIIKHAVKAVDKYYTYQGFKNVQHIVKNIMCMDQDDACYKRLYAKFQNEIAKHPRLKPRVQSDVSNDPGFQRNQDFLKAVKKNNLANVEQLVAKGANINFSNELGQTALYITCENGYVDVVRFLLARKEIQINQAEGLERTPLVITCYYGHVDVVRLMLARKEIQINQASEDGVTPLFATCQQGNVDIVRLLLARNEIQINQATKDGSSPLAITCQKGHVDVVRLLLARKEIQINQATENGVTPLFCACQDGHVDVVRLLLARKEIQIHPAADGTTPLFMASLNGHNEIVTLLQQHRNRTSYMY
jgi:ankyrin repeat protein